MMKMMISGDEQFDASCAAWKVDLDRFRLFLQFYLIAMAVAIIL